MRSPILQPSPPPPLPAVASGSPSPGREAKQPGPELSQLELLQNRPVRLSHARQWNDCSHSIASASFPSPLPPPLPPFHRLCLRLYLISIASASFPSPLPPFCVVTYNPLWWTGGEASWCLLSTKICREFLQRCSVQAAQRTHQIRPKAELVLWKHHSTKC